MENILNFSMYKGEPDWMCQNRLHAYKLLDTPMDMAILNSFEEKDERGYGIIANLSYHNSMFIQYGCDTIFEQMLMDDRHKGVVMLDLFEAFDEYEQLLHLAFKQDTLHTQQQLRMRSYFNGGLFIYIPNEHAFDVDVIFVQDNNIEEVSMKYIVIVQHEKAKVKLNVSWQQFNQNINNINDLKIIKYIISQ